MLSENPARLLRWMGVGVGIIAMLQQRTSASSLASPTCSSVSPTHDLTLPTAEGHRRHQPNLISVGGSNANGFNLDCRPVALNAPDTAIAQLPPTPISA